MQQSMVMKNWTRLGDWITTTKISKEDTIPQPLPLVGITLSKYQSMNLFRFQLLTCQTHELTQTLYTLQIFIPRASPTFKTAAYDYADCTSHSSRKHPWQKATVYLFSLCDQSFPKNVLREGSLILYGTKIPQGLNVGLLHKPSCRKCLSHIWATPKIN